MMLEDKQAQQLYRTAALHELWARTRIFGKAQRPGAPAFLGWCGLFGANPYRIKTRGITRYDHFEANITLPMGAVIIDIPEALPATEPQCAQPDVSGVSPVAPIVRAVEVERVEMLAAPVKDDLEDGMEVREGGVDVQAPLVGQQQRIKHLLAQFRPQSPTIGDSITPRMREVRDEVDRRFGPFSAIGCYRPGSDGEHPLGRACDFMLSTGGVMPTASSIQKGYDIAAWAQANASRLGIMYIIYRQRIWDVRMESSGWVPMEDRGSITANHYDHVHISVF